MHLSPRKAPVFFVYPVKSSTVAYEPESESMIEALPSSLFMYVSIDAVRSDFFCRVRESFLRVLA